MAMAINKNNDYVSRLKMYCDGKRWVGANYTDRDLTTKPSDPPMFEVCCRLFADGNEVKGIGRASTKKLAKHLSSKDALIQLGVLKADENDLKLSQGTAVGNALQSQDPKFAGLQLQKRENFAESVSETTAGAANSNALCDRNAAWGDPVSPKKPRLDVIVDVDVSVPVPEPPQAAVEVLHESSLGDQQKNAPVLVNMVPSSTAKQEWTGGQSDREPKSKITCETKRDLCKKLAGHVHHRFLELVVNKYVPANTRFEKLSHVDSTLKLLASLNDDCFSHYYNNDIPVTGGICHSYCYLEYDPKGKVGGLNSGFLGSSFNFEDAQRAAGQKAIEFLQEVANE